MPVVPFPEMVIPVPLFILVSEPFAIGMGTVFPPVIAKLFPVILNVWLSVFTVAAGKVTEPPLVRFIVFPVKLKVCISLFSSPSVSLVLAVVFARISAITIPETARGALLPSPIIVVPSAFAPIKEAASTQFTIPLTSVPKTWLAVSSAKSSASKERSST